MQSDLRYSDLPGEVGEALRRSLDVARRRGCEAEQLVVDPGLGFGKSANGSLQLIGELDRLLGEKDAVAEATASALKKRAAEFGLEVRSLGIRDLILPGDTGALASEYRDLLPVGAQIVAVDARSGTIEEMTAAFRLNLMALSLLALVVGLFLIYNTMTFSVVQRRGLFGTLRCLGVTRGEVFVLVVSEALVVGVIGAFLGLGLGIVMGRGAVGAVTQTISDLYFVVTVQEIEIATTSLVKGALLGILATVLAAAPPAWEAASVPARAALSRSGLERKARRAVAWVAVGSLVLLALGLGLLAISTGNLAVSFAGTLAVIVAFAALTPLATTLLMRVATRPLGRIWGALGRMAPRDINRSLSRTSVAIAALMTAVSVIVDGLERGAFVDEFDAIDALGAIGEGAAPAVPFLIEWLAHYMETVSQRQVVPDIEPGDIEASLDGLQSAMNET